jgi:hypothetical protein
MAIVAIPTESASMGVIPGMTVNTRLGHLKSDGLRLSMAGCAFQISMGAVEREVRALVVIKSPDVPTIGVMARFAFRPERTIVLVICAMARITGNILEPEIVTGMAGFAWRNCV